VETARGIEFGDVVIANRMVDEKETVQPLRTIMRIATPEDCAIRETNAKKEKEAFGICQQKIKDHKLEMKLVDVEYTFDNSKLLFYFTADGRVDFRELVKDLASVFRTRIELRQIGIRDEAKMMGGLGVCGRPFCCSTFLSDFVQVSIKMAKEQSLSLNSAKISGACGRLMCCLRYEHDTYEAQLKKMPPVDSRVQISDGIGIVTEVIPLEEKMKVVIPGKDNTTVTKTISLSDVRSVVSYPTSKKDKAKKAEAADIPTD
jgi:cell fate regulator YaaT (PSP1 superfamily)